MALFTKTAEGGGTWRLRYPDGTALGRVWQTAHIDRLLRDTDFAEAVVNNSIPLTGTARRAPAITAFNTWTAAGGNVPNFQGLTHSNLNDAGEVDGNVHLYLDGVEMGYLHGGEDNTPGLIALRARLRRCVEFSIRFNNARAIGGTAARNAATDAAIQWLQDNGGVS